MHKSGGFLLGTLYENITSLCTEKGIKGGKMCVDLGISKSLMTKLRDNPARQITSETAKKIADYFGVSVERVLTGEKENAPGPKAESVNEKLLIDLFRQLSPERQQEELAYLAQAAKRGAVQDM
jgi:transcriptional regulator with XRE-family HTH domain